MYRLLYYHQTQLWESYDFPTLALARWKQRELNRLGQHIYGHFVIEKIC